MFALILSEEGGEINRLTFLTNTLARCQVVRIGGQLYLAGKCSKCSRLARGTFGREVAGTSHTTSRPVGVSKLGKRCQLQCAYVCISDKTPCVVVTFYLVSTLWSVNTTSKYGK